MQAEEDSRAEETMREKSNIRSTLTVRYYQFTMFGEFCDVIELFYIPILLSHGPYLSLLLLFV